MNEDRRASIYSKGHNILFLGDKNNKLLKWLVRTGESVIQSSGKISPEYILHHQVGFIISYGYRHLIKKDILTMLGDSAINLHISYLPWNRGADPNFWSFVDGTPKGVTIHHLDESLDTGDIIVQRMVTFDEPVETLESSYHRLQVEIQELFKENWETIKSGQSQRTKQRGVGSVHKRTDKECFSHLLTHGWATKVVDVSYGSR